MRTVCALIIILSIFSALFSQDSSKLDEAAKLIEDREYEKAKPILEDLYKADENNPQVNYFLGRVALQENNYDDAIDYFDVAIEKDENNAEYYFWMGNAYARKAQNVGALKAMFAAPKAKSNWEKALELNSGHVGAKQSLFQYYLMAPGVAGGSNDKAKNIADEIFKDDEPLGHAFLAMYYWNADKNLEKTEEEVTKSLEVDSTYKNYKILIRSAADLYNTIGYSHLNENKLDKSKIAFSRAIEINPENANVYDSMGDYYVAIARYDTALICYEKAVQVNPEFAISRFNTGKMLEKLGRKDEAILVYKKLVEEMPKNQYAEQSQDRLDDLR